MSASTRLRVGYSSHVGRVRTHNEDALFVLTADQLGHLAPDGSFGVFILADGMGGHQAGEVASLLAARVVAQRLALDILVPYLSGEQDAARRKPIANALCDAIAVADRAVKDQVVGGGTTLTCALLMGDHVHFAHVGDSRAYLWTDEGLRQVTRDHSLVDRLIEMGQISPAAALYHPQRNVLYRAVGQGEGVEVDTYVEPFAGGVVLLCSDGLWGMVPDEQLVQHLARGAPPQETCDALIAAANQAGGKDNITVILIAKECP